MVFCTGFIEYFIAKTYVLIEQCFYLPLALLTILRFDYLKFQLSLTLLIPQLGIPRSYQKSEHVEDISYSKLRPHHTDTRAVLALAFVTTLVLLFSRADPPGCSRSSFPIDLIGRN